MPSKLHSVLGLTSETRTFADDGRWPDGQCRVGIELELEGFKTPPTNAAFKYWEVKNDGSLRDYDGMTAHEFLTTVPLCGQDLTNALAEFQHFLDRRTTPIASERTSSQVHLDVRTLSMDELEALLALYILFEDALFNFADTSRRTNIYCVPWNDSAMTLLYSALGKKEKIDKQLHKLRQLTTGAHTLKYAALNIVPIFRQGSVEFRHFPGTTNVVGKFSLWIKLIMRLYAACQDTRFQKGGVLHLLPAVGARTLTEMVFGEQATALLAAQPSLDHLNYSMNDAMRTAKELIFKEQFHRIFKSVNKTTDDLILNRLRKYATKHKISLPDYGKKKSIKGGGLTETQVQLAQMVQQWAQPLPPEPDFGEEV